MERRKRKGWKKIRNEGQRKRQARWGLTCRVVTLNGCIRERERGRGEDKKNEGVESRRRGDGG